MSEPPPKTETASRGRPRWPRIAGWTALGAALALIALVVWVFTADLGVLKPRIERFVTESTGRALRIDGDLDIHVGALTTVRAAGIRFANAEWADDATMVEVGMLEVHFDLWSLLGDTFHVEYVNVDDAEIRLVINEAGDANWRLGKESLGAAPKEPGSFDFRLKQIEVDRVDLYLDDPRRSRPLAVRFEEFDQSYRSDDNLELSVRGDVDGRPVSLSGWVGTWSAILSGTDVEYDIEGSLDTVNVSSSGTIDSLIRPGRPTLRFTANGPDIDDLTSMFGLGTEGVGNIDVEGTLLPEDGGPLSLNVAGNVGRNQIDATGTFSDLQNLKTIDFSLDAHGPNLANILHWLGVDWVGNAPYSAEIRATRDGDSFELERLHLEFGEASFDMIATLPNFPSLDDGTATLDVVGTDIERFRFLIGLPGAATGPFSLNAELGVSPTGEESIVMTVETSLGLLQAAAVLGPTRDFYGTRVDIDLSAPSLATVGDRWGIPNLPDEPIEASGIVEFSAEGVRTIEPLRSSVYDVTVMVDGTIATRAGLIDTDVGFELTGPDLSELIGAFGPSGTVPVQPYALKGRLQIGEDGYRFRDVGGTLGSSTVAIDGLLASRSRVIGSRFDIEAEGPAFEELFNAIAEVDVAPGSYELAVRIGIEDGLLMFEDVALMRDGGDLEGDLNLGLPVSRRYADFDFSSKGRDVRVLYENLRDFEPDELPFSLTVVGEWRNLDWSFDRMRFTVGDASWEASGTLNQGEQSASTEFLFEGNVPSLASLGTIDGYRMRDMPLNWSGRITGTEEMLQMEYFLARLGDSDIRGRVAFYPGDVPRFEVDVSSDSIVVVPLLEEDAEQDETPAPEYADGRLIPDVPLPFDAMRSFDASLEIDIGVLRRDTLDLRDIDIDVDLHGGVLDVARFDFRPRSGRFAARGRLDPVDGRGEASLEIVARDFALGVSEMNLDAAMSGTIDVSVTSSGADLRTLFANLDGALMIDARGGRVANNRFLRAVYGDVIQEIVSAINPFSETEETTDLDCIVIPWLFADGMMTTTPNSLIRTDKIQILNRGTIDLRDEQIDLNVRTSPRSGLTISAGELVNPFVKIVGTMAEPRLAVDEQGVLITGGAAVATGGLTIIARAVWDRMSRSPDPCGEVSTEARAELGNKLPDWGDDIPLVSRDE